MLQVWHPGRLVMILFWREQTASVQLCCVGVCLSPPIDRQRQERAQRQNFIWREWIWWLYFYLQLQAEYLFPDLMSITGQKEMPPPSSLLSCCCRRGQPCPACTGRFSRCSALVHLYILTLPCVLLLDLHSPLERGERSQETVWPHGANYVFTARQGSHWACSALYVSPAAGDKGCDVGVDGQHSGAIKP